MSEYGGSNVRLDYGAQVWVNNIIPHGYQSWSARSSRVSRPWPALAGRVPRKLFKDPWNILHVRLCGFAFVRPFRGTGKSNWRVHCKVSTIYVVVFEDWELTEYRFPNTSTWVTEFNLNNQSLRDTQSFYNMSAQYLDRLPHIERYSFFGAFRSSVSNVGTNAAMLSTGGRLTDIGKWYLGRAGDGVDPNSAESGNAAPGIRCAVFCSLMSAFLAILLVT
jgi:hypothetical protein